MDNSLPTQPIVPSTPTAPIKPVEPMMPPQPAPTLPPTPPAPKPWQPPSVMQSTTSPTMNQPASPVIISPVPPKSSSNFLLWLIPLLLILVAAGIGAFYYLQNNPNPFSPTVVTPTPVPEEIQQACTLEAMVCPDGSSVGRTGPNCEFAECPAAPEPTQSAEVSMTTYSNTANGYEIKHPSNWTVVNLAAGSNGAAAGPDSVNVDIQSPGLTLGNVTISPIQTVPAPTAQQTKTEEVINGKTYVVYSTTVDNMTSKTYYVPAKNNSFLEVLMRPVTIDNSATFQTMIESMVVTP